VPVIPCNRPLVRLLAALWLAGAIVPAAAQQPTPPDSTLDGPIADEGVPYGVASGYIVGHKLLQEGKAEEALPFLHLAYRAQPEVAAIALDFQQALAGRGYFKDALDVVNRLVALYPDSLGYVAERASLYLKSGKTGPALDDLRLLRSKGKVSLAIIEAEAGVLAAGGKTEQALDVYRDGLILLPELAPDLYLGMTAVLQQAGRDKSIPALMDEAMARHPDHARLWLVKARVQAVLGDEQGAMATAQAADNHFAALAVAQAVAPLAAAAGTQESAAEIPDLPADSFVVDLADFYAQRQQVDKAVGILQPLSAAGELQLSPSLWLARLLLGTDRTAEADALIARIMERWPEAGRGWFLRGKSAEGRGEWLAALPDYVHAVGLEPRDPEIRLGYVRAMLVAWEKDLVGTAATDAQREKRAEFGRQLAIAVQLVPDEDREGQLILGYAFKALNDFKAAAERFGLAAESKDLRLNALLQMSLCHDQGGDSTAARADLETLYAEFPENPEIANSLGYFLAEKGVDLGRAARLVDQALQAEPGNGAYLDSMGWILYRRGEMEQSLDFMIQAVNVLPEDPVVLEHLGMVLKAQGKPVEALDVLRRALDFGADRTRLEPMIKDLEQQIDGR
jgi:tetratricopeptide (TPR) repeat protein